MSEISFKMGKMGFWSVLLSGVGFFLFGIIGALVEHPFLLGITSIPALILITLAFTPLLFYKGDIITADIEGLWAKNFYCKIPWNAIQELSTFTYNHNLYLAITIDSSDDNIYFKPQPKLLNADVGGNIQINLGNLSEYEQTVVKKIVLVQTTANIHRSFPFAPEKLTTFFTRLHEAKHHELDTIFSALR